MFWALDQRRKWRAKMRAEAIAEGEAQGLVKGYAEAKQEFDVELQRIAQAAREQGVKLDDLPQR